ncbi:alanine racemase [Fundidesulfovibrio butyratiphilus]
MSIEYGKIRTRIDPGRLVDNYRLLASPNMRTLAVIKADAYGHGIVETAKALTERAGADSFAVGTVEEGVHLRQSGQSGRIVSLLGALESFEYPALWEHDLIGFVHSFDQLERLAVEAAARPDRTLPVALKFDTGMGRLGFTLEDVPALCDRLATLPGLAPVMLSSHLATADEPWSEEYTVSQAACFEAIRRALADRGHDLECNLANSAAILARPEIGYQSRRLGIALYGCNPFAGTALAHLGEGLAPAMSARTLIVSVHPLKTGRSISYGRTFIAPKDMTVAIVAAGYADAYSRGLSGKGAMWLKGVRVPILGRVCMQLTAVDVTGVEGVKAGDAIHLLGGEGPGRITPEDLAAWWGTITYEVFCLLGMNRREYV